ncbi:uncharacterized protein YbjT (DUF2867 family) [Hymenobacter luteus]|uniref:Uncharacterized protein YbjT (DUF2867 family) n=2 Tax=Hymenobacter TaxID=89966 RepID=A0A7W9T4R8_9BACT|nr:MULTISPECIES: SDR family oxidoreductase [Hymenobacter]MBB4603734.1 uncharacterized protein YbjT (DUF2867 family) [Hymenobacter latericoloratus]MBB6061510.1 uncharacterized protein YbjT (DUF2867 family) [Hymenobacter luteus]
MDLLILGATGPTGRLLVKQALRDGHIVTALVRNPAALADMAAPRLQVLAGDVLQPATLPAALAGQQAVLSALGQGRGTQRTTLFSEGGRNVIEAMRAAGVKRFIGLTSAGVPAHDPSFTWFYKYLIRGILLRHVYADMILFEAYLRQQAQDIDWTVVRPSTLIDQPDKEEYRVAEGRLPSGGSRITREHVAEFMLEQLSSEQYRHQAPTLAY